MFIKIRWEGWPMRDGHIHWCGLDDSNWIGEKPD